MELNVSLRFYGRLNDFLPPGRRSRRFAYALRGPASVKDTIEAVGVPHPEVDLVLVNGEACGFATRVRDGDEIAIYPAFSSIDLGELQRVGGAPPEPVRFALDVHLGKLASLLRLTGFDAAVRTDDADLARLAGDEGRVALTRDVVLLKRNEVRYGHWVRNIAPARQLAEILERYDLFGAVRPFTRCLRCNVPLAPTEAAAAAGRVPPRVRAAFDEFQACPACRRVFWKGSHYQDMRRILARVLRA